ncbi:proline-rich receptor-like protein kinase PERK2 [Eucalyptus grandis]|uniref:proline-rich receptor-like protein kinase PERK2 n=1 Tax=Eucalyptus grandis TaxID=71139 RepID=UPI00192F0E20|nr:proline-rich receptor-like protein kinase PERK2 [Eucalyptus grandis]
MKIRLTDSSLHRALARLPPQQLRPASAPLPPPDAAPPSLPSTVAAPPPLPSARAPLNRRLRYRATLLSLQPPAAPSPELRVSLPSLLPLPNARASVSDLCPFSRAPYVLRSSLKGRPKPCFLLTGLLALSLQFVAVMDPGTSSAQIEGERAVRSLPVPDHGPSSRGGVANENLGDSSPPVGPKQPSVQGRSSRDPRWAAREK